MTFEEHINRLECFKEALESYRPFGLAVQDVHALRSERIFTDGKNSGGGSIGQYNTTTPIYINPQKSPKKFSVQGKPNSNVKKQDRKTRYFGSYSEFRQTIGRQTAVVDLNLWGDLKSNFENRSRGNPQATKIADNEYHVGLDGENSKKKGGLEKKYGEIFAHTEDEKTHFYDTCSIELEIQMNKCLQRR